MILDLSSFRSGTHQGFLVQLLKDWPSPSGFYSKEALGAFCVRLNNFKLDPGTTVIHDSSAKTGPSNSENEREVIELKTSIKTAQKSYPERYENSVDIWVLSAVASGGKTRLFGNLPSWIRVEGQLKNGDSVRIKEATQASNKNSFSSMSIENLERVWLGFFSQESQRNHSCGTAAFDAGRGYVALSFRMSDLIINHQRGLPVQTLGIQIKTPEVNRNGFSEE